MLKKINENERLVSYRIDDITSIIVDKENKKITLNQEDQYIDSSNTIFLISKEIKEIYDTLNERSLL